MCKIEIYEIPFDFTQLFNEVHDNDGKMSYRIVDYTDGMDMDNIQSMQYFLSCIGIWDEYVEEDYGTQVVVSHPEFLDRIVVDSGGLGDFYSHGFDCYWEEN